MFDQAKAYYKKLLPCLHEEDWNVMQEKFTIQKLKKGEFLIRNGEICQQVNFINKGLLRMFYLVDGKETCTAFVCENEYFSDYSSFLTRQPSHVNIDALEDCELINLSFDDMQAIYKSNPVFETFGRKIAEMLFIMISSKTTGLLTMTPGDYCEATCTAVPVV